MSFAEIGGYGTQNALNPSLRSLSRLEVSPNQGLDVLDLDKV